MKETYVAHYVMYLDDFFLEDSIESAYPHVDKILIARTMKPWFGAPADLTDTEATLVRVLDRYGDKIELYADTFPDEQTQRNFLIDLSRARGHAGAFIIDCDEVFIGNAFYESHELLREHKPRALRLPYLTFVRDASFCIGPPYEDNLFYIDISARPVFTFARKCNAPQILVKLKDPGILHFSYLRRDDEDILKKVRSLMHAYDTNWERWYQDVYMKFKPGLRDFHPVEPRKWRSTQPFDARRFPESLRRKLMKHGKLSQSNGDEVPRYPEEDTAMPGAHVPGVGAFESVAELRQGVVNAVSADEYRQDAAIKPEKKAPSPERHPPTCSIVIPVFNKLSYTMRCYEALRQNSDGVSHEVIFVDNASSDGTYEFLSSRGGSVKIIRNNVNVGYTKACNQGARAAEGKYVVFLNNDTEPGPAWLAEMVRLAEADPSIGVIGSKLVYPDGRLQEAGGIIFRDGSGWNYGRHGDPSSPEYNYVREVDYVSGASLMVRRDLLEDLGYLDERFAPGYYEDTDLCFTARSRGYRVVYCPFSTVVHHEGVSSGTDLSSGMKRYQTVNREKFVAKWSTVLGGHEVADPKNVVAATERGTRGNILVIDRLLPWYDRASGALRLYSILLILKSKGYHITYIARNGQGQPHYTRRLQELGVEVYVTDPAKLRALGVEVRAKGIDLGQILKRREYAIAWLSFYDVALQYTEEIRFHSPRTRIVVDTVDIHFVREFRMGKLNGDEESVRRAAVTKKRELAAYRRADAVITVTEQDWDHVRAHLPKQRHFVIPNVHTTDEAPAEVIGRQGLLFIGNFGHPPNRDAVKYFVSEIFPLVRSEKPDVVLTIVGNNPPEDVADLRSESVRLTGYVPSVEPYLREARVSIAPLRYGAGMKGKIGEAMACGLPVVTTTVGAEGMGIINEVHALVADSPSGLAANVVKLLSDDKLWSSVSEQGKKHVREHYSPSKVTEHLSLMISELAADRRSAKKATELSCGDAGACIPGQTARGATRKAGLVSIVILTFNELSFTKRCVESIRLHTPEPHEIIFVDNGSTDGTVKWLRKLVKADSRYRLVENGKNLGFAQGCNQGIEASSGEYILLLNNDVVVTSEWLAGLLECLHSAPDVGIVGPMTNNISGSQRVPGARYDMPTGLESYAAEFRESHRHRRIPQRRIVGFCMLFRGELVDKIGALDESFGSGNFEDDDLCLRSTMAGYRNMIAGDVFIHHYGSRSFIGNRIDYREAMSRNRALFKRKWDPAGLTEAEARKVMVQETVERADRACDLGDTERAVTFLLQGLRVSPDDATLYHKLAELLIDAKRFDEALEVLREMPRSENDARALALRGYCKEGQALYEEAEEFADRSLACQADFAPALNVKGMVMYRRGDKEGAAAYFGEALKSDPGYGEPWTNLGVLRWSEGKHEKAHSSLERGFVLSPRITDIVTTYHSAVTAMGRFKEAEERFREALALYPQDRRITFFLIDCLIQQGKYGEALGLVQEALVAFGADDGALDAALQVRMRADVERTEEVERKTRTLSLCMIVRNEEEHLAKCLLSVRGLVDELVVVDTGSMDRTRDIAGVFGAKVFEFSWTNDFSAARNYAISKATGEWILILDADEVISEVDHPRLRGITQTVHGRPAAYRLVTRNYTNMAHLTGWIHNRGEYAEEAGTGWFPSKKVRLFKRDRRVCFENPVHELLEASLERAGIVIRDSDIPVHHYGKLDEKRTLEKAEAYYELGKRKLDSAGKDPQAVYELAVQAAELGRFEEAVLLWKDLLDSGKTSNAFRGRAFLNLSLCLLQLSRYEEAREASGEALAAVPGLKEAALNCALADLCVGHAEEALQTLDGLLGRYPDYPPALGLRSVVCLVKGEKEKGVEWIRRLRASGYKCSDYLSDSAKKLISAGRTADALRVLEGACETGYGTTEVNALLEGCREGAAVGI